MLLINGKLYDNIETAWALEQVKTKIPITLSQPLLNQMALIDATDKFANDVLEGVYDSELLPYLGDRNHFLLIQEMVSMIKRESLLKRIYTELRVVESLRDTNNSIHLAPLGTLLHIAAGNVDALPAYSVLEGLLAGNINILKLPASDNGLSIYLLRKLIDYMPELKSYIYVFDTPSSDIKTIEALMEEVNGIVVWGSDEAVKAVRSNAPINTKIIEWGHKLSFAYIYDLEVSDHFLSGLAKNILESKQLLCSSCQVIYVNTDDFKRVKEFGYRFSNLLKGLEAGYDNPAPIQGRITIELATRKLEGIFSRDICYQNKNTSVICQEDSKLELSLQFGNVLVKPLPFKDMIKTLYPHKSHLQTAYLYPKNEFMVESFLRVGITNICDIDNIPMHLTSHDGSFPLLQYSRIVEIS